MMKKIIIIVFLSLFLTASVFCEIRYIEIGSSNISSILINDIDDFEAIINEYGIRIGFISKDNEKYGFWDYPKGENKTVYVMVNSVYFSFKMNGYSTLSDYKNGKEKNFKNGADYYQALNKGFNSSEIYYFYINNHFHSVDDSKNAYKNGFKDSDTYYEAVKAGYAKFSEYEEYLDYTQRGFRNKSDWQTAKPKGFYSGPEYYTAVENGFLNYKEFDSARKIGLTTNEDYQKFNNMVSNIEKIMNDRNLNKKNAVIYYYIQNIPKGEMGLSALSSTLVLNHNTQKSDFKKAINFWCRDIKNNDAKNREDVGARNQDNSVEFIFSQSSLSEFFSSVDISSLGTYNSKTEIFIRKKQSK